MDMLICLFILISVQSTLQQREFCMYIITFKVYMYLMLFTVHALTLPETQPNNFTHYFHLPPTDGGLVGRVYYWFNLMFLFFLLGTQTSAPFNYHYVQIFLYAWGIKYCEHSFSFSNLFLNCHKMFYRQRPDSTRTMYFYIPRNGDNTARLPCSCYCSMRYINSWVAN